MTELQLIRQAKRRLAILQHAEEVTGNVARTCRYYGIESPWVCWRLVLFDSNPGRGGLLVSVER